MIQINERPIRIRFNSHGELGTWRDLSKPVREEWVREAEEAYITNPELFTKDKTVAFSDLIEHNRRNLKVGE